MRGKIYKWLPLVSWLAAMTLTAVLANAVNHSEHLRLERSMIAQADHIAADIQVILEGRILALVRMAKRLEANASSVDGWKKDAGLYLDHYPGYEFIAWLDSSYRVIGRVQSEAGSAFPPPGMRPDEQNAFLRQAHDTRQPVISPIIEVSKEIKILRVYIPILPGAGPGGFLAASFRLHEALDPELLQQHYLGDGYISTLTDGHVEISFPEGASEKNKREWGAPAKEIMIYGARWTTTVWPTDKILGGAESGMGIWIILGGVVLSSLMSWAIYQAQRSRTLTEWFQATNAELAEQITERMKVSEGLTRLNRLHSMLSRVSDAIVHIDNVNGLYDEINRIAVEEGGFLLAWIGILDPATRLVAPVSFAGNGKTYLDGIRISVDRDVPEGMGPIGKAMRENSFFVCNDIEHSTEMLPWRDKAVAHGYRSSAAFSFRVNGHIEGAFAIYSGTAGYFEEDEISLLQRLVDDIAFAIASIEKEGRRRAAEQELKKFMAGIEHSVNAIVITDTNGSIEYVNPTFEKVTGWSRNEAIGKNPNILKSGETSKEVYDNLWNTIKSGNTWRGTLRNRRKDGRKYWGEIVISPITDDRGNIIQFLAVQEDVTEKKATREMADYLANYDELTGLANRGRFMELLKQSMQTLHFNGGQGVLLLVDIDAFSVINDAYGHTAGDEMLRGLGRNLKEMVATRTVNPDSCLIARLGGDEFVIFLPDHSLDDGLELARQIRQNSTVSISLVSFPEHAVSPDDMMVKADAALRSAKKLGSNVCHAYRPADRLMEDLHLRVSEKARIEDALDKSRFVPWFQPILCLADNRVYHYEVLARMLDEEGRIIFPEGFISTAEQMGMIGAIDIFIMKEAMALQVRERREGRYASFSVNISGKNLGNEELLAKLKNAISETRADPAYLVFEITETAAIQNMEKAITFIEALKQMGCKIALDDFGVGFTAFSYLKELRVDYLKIDGSFIRNLHKNTDDQHIVRSIASMAKGLGVMTIAEYVENDEILALVREYGVDYAQGFFIGRPEAKLC